MALHGFDVEMLRKGTIVELLAQGRISITQCRCRVCCRVFDGEAPTAQAQAARTATQPVILRQDAMAASRLMQALSSFWQAAPGLGYMAIDRERP